MDGACGLPPLLLGAVWGGASLTASVTVSLREPQGASVTNTPVPQWMLQRVRRTVRKAHAAHSASQCMRLRPPTLKSPCLHNPSKLTALSADLRTSGLSRTVPNNFPSGVHCAKMSRPSTMCLYPSTLQVPVDPRPSMLGKPPGTEPSGLGSTRLDPGGWLFSQGRGSG